MRIISKFRDYYDSVQAHGVDKRVIYNRVTKNLDTKSKKHKYLLTTEMFDGLFGNDVFRGWPVFDDHPTGLCFTNQVLIFFCGKIYPCFVYENRIREAYTIDTEYLFCYTLDNVKSAISLHGTKKEKKNWFDNKKQKKSDWFVQEHIEIPKLIKKIELINSNKSLTNIHHKLGVPIFMWWEAGRISKFVVNPNLSQLKFYKVKPVYQAYQDISSFISGVLGGQSPPMIKISDEDRKSMHGFDKWSFKKHPQKKK
jgi:hypothetical protein